MTNLMIVPCVYEWWKHTQAILTLWWLWVLNCSSCSWEGLLILQWKVFLTKRLSFRLSVLQASACNTDTTPTQPHRNSNTHRTKNNTTNVVIQQNSHKLLMMDILMSESCWAHKKWNKMASDIKLVFYSSTMHQEKLWIHLSNWRFNKIYLECSVFGLLKTYTKTQ